MEKADGHNEQWVDKKLIELADYWNGMAFKPSDWSDDGVKIIRIEQLNNPLGDYDHYKGSFPEINAIHDGDLIFSWSATLKVAIWKWGDGVLNQHLFKVVPFEKIDKHFLYFLLDYNMPKLGESSHGSTMKHIKRKELETYSVSIPDSLPAQRRIAAILSSADKVIEQTRQLIGKYKSIKQGMMEDLLKPKEGWKKVRLGDGLVKSICTGKLDANAMVEGGVYRFYTCAKDYTFIDNYAFDDEALLISGNGEYVGYVHYYKGKFNAYQRTYVLREFSIDVFYLQCYLNTYLRDRIKKEMNAGSIPFIKMGTLTEMDICYPASRQDQKRIASILSGIDAKIAAEEKVLEKYEKMKKGLMEKLFDINN